MPATTGFLIGIDSCNRHLGLKETAKLTGHTGVTSCKYSQTILVFWKTIRIFKQYSLVQIGNICICIAVNNTCSLHKGLIFKGKLWEQYFSNIESGQGLEDYSMFSSPWAQSFEDEQFFMDATSTIGKVIFKLQLDL